MIKSLIKHKANISEEDLFPRNSENHYIEIKHAKKIVVNFFEKNQILNDMLLKFENDILLERNPIIRE